MALRGLWKRGRFLIGTVAAAIALSTPTLAAAEPSDGVERPVAVSASADSWSSYWWRGARVTDRATIQPCATLSFERAGIELSYWSSYALASRDRLQSADEIDLILTYAMPVSVAGRSGAVNVGYTQYFFTAYAGDESHTEEVMAGVSSDGFLAPSLTAYYDAGLFDEVYLEAGIEPEIPLGSGGSPALVICAIVGAGQNGEPFGLRNAEAACGVRFPVGSAGLTPRVGFGYAPSGPNKGERLFFAGLALAFGE